MDNPVSFRTALIKATLVGGLAVGILDALDAIVAYKLALGLSPIAIYQFVASGALGPSAFSGGLAAALLGLAVHFVIAFSVAFVFAGAATIAPVLVRHFAAAGAIYGVGVYAFMNYVVIPLSAIPSSSPSVPLLLNGVIGHALLVGLPAAIVAKRYVSADPEARRTREHAAA
jgi:hypothetical protein